MRFINIIFIKISKYFEKASNIISLLKHFNIIRPGADLELVLAMGRRENCLVSPVGEVTADGRVILVDSLKPGSVPFDLPLSLVLGKMPQKEYSFTTPKAVSAPLDLPVEYLEDVGKAVKRVLRLVDVGSKRFLTNKVT